MDGLKDENFVIDVFAVTEYLKELGWPLPTTIVDWHAAAIAKFVDDEIMREIIKNG